MDDLRLYATTASLSRQRVTEMRETFEEHGVFVLDGVIDRATCTSVVAALRGYEKPSATPAWAEAYGRFDCEVIASELATGDRSQVRAPVAEHPSVLSATRAILPAGSEPFVDVVFVTHRGGRQAWHIDSDRGVFINRLFYPEDIDEAQGALIYVPGSHLGATLEAGGPQDPIAGEVHLVPKAGTVVLLDSRVQHRVPENRTDRRRICVNLRERRLDVARDTPIVARFRNGSYDFSGGER